MAYLLSSGKSTNRIEEYILDLFRINLIVYPRDIPHMTIGSDFIITNTPKSELGLEITSRINRLIDKISEKFQNINIEVKSLSLIDEETIDLVLNINGIISDDIYINIIEDNL